MRGIKAHPFRLLNMGAIHLVILAAIVSSGCGKIEVDRLYSIRLDAPPAEGHWEAAVPLFLKAGGGHVTGRMTSLTAAADDDAVHEASASCHHGPPVTDPVPLELRSWYDSSHIYLEARWEDVTENRSPRSWRRGADRWEVGEEDEDGVAILWSRYPGRFGCQEACHVDDWSVRGGALIDQRSMYLKEEGEWEEAWVWKSAAGARELILDSSGFTVAGTGTPYRRPNSTLIGDDSLTAEARRAGLFGPGDGPAVGRDGNPLQPSATSSPAYLFGEGVEGASLSVQAVRWRKGWKVTFSRPLEAEGERQVFSPGGEYRFGVAVFDGTSTDHHIVRDVHSLRLVAHSPE